MATSPLALLSGLSVHKFPLHYGAETGRNSFTAPPNVEVNMSYLMG